VFPEVLRSVQEVLNPHPSKSVVERSWVAEHCWSPEEPLTVTGELLPVTVAIPWAVNNLPAGRWGTVLQRKVVVIPAVMRPD